MSQYSREEIIEKVKNRESLSHADLSGLDLREANLTRADLGGANLTGADLSKASFMGATLFMATLIGTNLNKANLIWANLSDANLSKANLIKANLSEANLRLANLSEANLSRASLVGTNLINADLRKAIFRNCYLRSANLNEANLSGADLTGANIWGIANTDWVIDGIKAEYVYNCNYPDTSKEEKEKTRIPPDRNFRPGEFQEWLSKRLPVEKLPLDDTPKVFISYSWDDKDSMQAIDQWLRNKGARVIVDERDFIAGADIRDEIVKWLREAGKVVCIYSKNSANRPYPKLERRIAQEREFAAQKKGEKQIILIYFCIDDTPLPPESTHRLAIKAKDKSFPDACQELWAGILEKSKAPKPIDLSQYDKIPPWEI